MPGVRGAAQERDRFGTALATGDFNDDGKDDLAIGVPGEDSNTGLVHILYGRGGVGLTAANTQIWTQDTDGLKGTAERGDRFGAALAAADFNGDGQDDLAIGIPNDAVESFDRAGAVQVLYSASGGLTATDQLWTLSVLGVRGIPAANDHFGTALAWGDFNGNGRADLAIGMPGKDVLVNGVLREFAGAVQVLYGSDNRLTVTGNQHWILGRNGLASKPGNGDQFGGALH